jgi:leucyl/phenylalanyl-tRNA---protein transferase
MFILDEKLSFPHPRYADKNGLLAIGGDLSPKRLLLAYKNGIFPWFNEDEPICWYSPNPRMVLFPDSIRVSKSMKQVLDKKHFDISFDNDFEAVIRACRDVPRQGQLGTWITESMINAYKNLFELGFAHSVEARLNGELVGGLYGIAIGKCFFGESMFAKVSNASKAAFITMVRKLQKMGFWLIDCQVYTEHLASLGAELIPRDRFLEYLKKNKLEEDKINF